ncbi:MAG: carboxy terminal-processing peptidase, partial [Bacteroidales bacterium]|nr:carboxy terminal-processing peptidase [Bacteroidales bacterium]
RQENAISDKDTSYKVMPFDSLEAKARQQVAEDYKQMFRRLHQQTEKDRMNAYLNAFVQSYDPHSEYMSPKEKKNFDIRMSGQFEGIGASLQELNNGYIKVARIIPGSASWRQGELKAGDIILKVAQGDKDPISIVGMRLDDAVQYIRGKKGTEVRLTVKKPDNSIVVIPIVRDVVILEETYAKSAILKDKNSNFKAGYIYLPSFYVDFKNRNGRHCSKDVEIEINKLKKEGVDGIILDLRYNGGGSLQDVVEMAGLFIDKGPIVQVKGRYGKPYILKDSDPKLQYEGKLIIMVNKLSASASEIMAAAMQDYGRAVIVGSPVTYGKGTVQKIVNLDQMLNRNYDDLKPLGNMRLTIQKFYRINGGATQLRGVKADIILPDIYAGIDIGESELDNVIPWDEIQPAQYTKWKHPITNLDEVKTESAKRVSANKDFNLIKQNAQRMKEQKENTVVNLNLEKYRASQKKIKEETKKYENVFKEKTSLQALILSADREQMQTDSIKKASFKDWTKNIEKDGYIEETVKILESLK